MSAAPSEIADLARVVGTLAARGMRLRTIVYRVHRAFEAAEKPAHHGTRAEPKHRLAGERYGLLVVRAYAGRGQWACVCDCGATLAVRSSALVGGARKTCGQCGTRGGLDRVRAACLDVAKLYALDGLTAAEIGARYDACLSSVLRVLHALDVPVRRSGPAVRRAA